MKRMLFNATQSEELRVAIVNENKLEDLDFERGNREQRKSNIYKAVVTRVEPSLEAAFVNYGVERHGFLPFKEIAPEYYSKKTRKKDISIRDVIKEGQEIIVQVAKDERGNKGAALTSYLSLAGRYIVLMPNNNDGGGISRRIEGDERTQFKEVLAQLKVTKGMSVIGRTAGIGASVEQIQWDLDYLAQLWKAIEEAANAQEGSFLIYQESNLVVRAIRDYFQSDIEEILIDKQSIYDQAHQFMSHVMPDYANRIKLYDEDTSLFSKFNIENQIESAFLREVQLPSGGSIVIDHTEALVSVDVNSSRSTRGRDIENTAFNTNVEAANELAKQLRLRDIGGLIVIDFIDMENQKNQREVENQLRDAIRQDKARIQLGRISRFGLLELSRQRLRPSLGESINGVCPRCNGTGRVRDIQSTALYILRLIQEEASRDEEQVISVQMPVEVATLILNEKRSTINEIEEKYNNDIVIIPNRYFEIPKFELSRSAKKAGKVSYTAVEPPKEDAFSDLNEAAEERLQPVVKAIVPEAQSNKKGKSNKSIFGFFKNLIAPEEENTPSSEIEAEPVTSSNTEPEEKENARPQRGNRSRNRRSNFRKRNQRDSRADSNERKTESVEETKATPPLTKYASDSIDTPKLIDSKKSEVGTTNDTPPAATKKKPTRRRSTKLPKLDLDKAGIELIETKADKPKTEEAKADDKPKTRKKASWQKKENTKDDEGQIELVETKAVKKTAATKKPKPIKKTAAKKTAAKD